MAREDDDKPIEIPIGKRPRNVVVNKQTPIRKPIDPRFNPKCSGSDDRRHFERNYAFINEIRQKELNELKKAFRKEKDPEKKSDIQSAIGRISHSMSGDVKSKNKRKDKKAELVEKFTDLKKTGRLSKYIERKRKKLMKRDLSKYQ